jgi:hypothetical protein
MISEASVRRAINHLGSFGDTDLFPRLPEMRCFPSGLVLDDPECSRTEALRKARCENPHLFEDG